MAIEVGTPDDAPVRCLRCRSVDVEVELANESLQVMGEAWKETLESRLGPERRGEESDCIVLQVNCRWCGQVGFRTRWVGKGSGETRRSFPTLGGGREAPPPTKVGE